MSEFDQARDATRFMGFERDAGRATMGALNATPGAFPVAGPGMQMGMGGFGLFSGGFRTAMGIDELANGEYVRGAQDTSGGLGWMASGAGDLLKGAGTTFGQGALNSAGSVLGRVGGGLGALSGGLQIYSGIDQLVNGDGSVESDSSAVGNLVKGGVGLAGGIAAAAGSTVATPLAASFGAGYALGDYGNRATADLGWFGQNEGVDAQGNRTNRTASDWAADTGVDAMQWVREATGSETLGDIAGFGTTALMTIPAAAASVGGAVVSGARAIGGAASDAWDAVTSW